MSSYSIDLEVLATHFEVYAETATSHSWHAWDLGNARMLRDVAKYIERLRNERDEAQRLYCAAVEEMERGLSNDSRQDVAKARGWDCYPEAKP